MLSRRIILASLTCLCLSLTANGTAAFGQSFRYEAKPKMAGSGLSYSSPDPAPRMMTPSEIVDGRAPRHSYPYTAARTSSRSSRTGYFDAALSRFRTADRRDHFASSTAEPITAGRAVDPFGEELPPGEGSVEQYDGYAPGDGYATGDEFASGDEYGYDDSGDGPYAGCGCRDAWDKDHDWWLHCPVVRCFFQWGKRRYIFSPAMWQNFNEFGGVQAFKNPVDLGVNGNFGFHKGINWASPLWDRHGIGFQLGGTIALSDFEGGQGIFGTHRDQYFVTAGLFRRATCNHGWQGGAVLDYLQDNFYVTLNLLQIRSEISYIACNHEVGFWSAAHTKSDTQRAPNHLELGNVTFQANDQYNLFYRYRFCNGATARSWIGLSSHADFIFGMDATVPLSERWAIQSSYNYIVPRNDPTISNDAKESFAVMVSLVWYPGYKVPNACWNPYRPLFNVADNGSFFVTQKAQ